MTVTVTVPGIGEPVSEDDKPIGMLRGIADGLGYDARHFNWRNQYGPVPSWNGTAYDKNLADATGALVETVDDVGEPVLLVGYSGGAHLASLAAPHCKKLAGLITVSNPIRRRGDGSAPFHGVAGEHEPFEGFRHFDLANPADIICCCPDEPFPIRGLSSLSKHFSLAEPLAWGRALFAELIAGQAQSVFRGTTLEDWWLALAYARGYLFDGQHTNYYPPQFPDLCVAVRAYIDTLNESHPEDIDRPSQTHTDAATEVTDDIRDAR